MRKLPVLLVFACLAKANAQDEVWLRPPVPPDMTPEQLAQTQQNKNQRDIVDARLAENRQLATLLKLAEEDLGQEEWGRAIQRLQGVLNQQQSGLVRIGPGEFVSVRSKANQLLTKLPTAWSKRYEQQFGAAADRMLSAAVREGDYVEVGNVATRYLHTDAGRRAIRVLMLRHFDRGEYGLVLGWQQQLVQCGHKPEGIDELTAAIARKRLGLKTDFVSDSVKVGTETVQTGDVLRQSEQVAEVVRTQLGWPQFLGSADRRARAIDRLPMMVEAWTHEILQRKPILDLLRRATPLVFDSANSVIPAGIPVVVGDKVACRTLEGVEVFDVKTGEPLWRTRTEASTRKLLSARTPRGSFLPQSSSQDRQSLLRFLFRDAVHGLLSSDGDRLYVVEQHQLPDVSAIRSTFRSSRSTVPPAYATNLITAYDLKTGRVEWSIGGPDSDEVFKPVLAGHYFHGVPTAHNNELYVVAEKDNAISLYALDATTGEPKWNQLLAYTETPIERASLRRLWAASVTVADGILLCPTTVDWLFAIDPLSRSVLWVHRVRPQAVAQSGRSAFLMRAEPPFGTRWEASAPLVVGNRVVYTPLEVANLVAIDVVTGKKAWSHPKRDACYLAGAHDGRAIVVGSETVSALDVADRGEAAWTFELNNDRPAGRGVMSGQFLHQPMASGQVISIDLDTGKLAQRTGENSGRERLSANLVLHEKGFVLQTLSSLEAYEVRPNIDQPAPTSPAEKLRAAEILLADTQFSKAIEAADAIDPADLSEALKSRRNEVLERSLTIRIRKEPQTAEADIERLSQLVDDADLITRFHIESQLRTDEVSEAFRKLIVFYKSDGSPTLSEYRYRVSRDAWLAGRLLDVWNKMDEPTRAETDDEIAELANNEETSARFARVFPFHPAAIEVLERSLRSDIADKQFPKAESALRKLQRYASNRAEELTFETATALALADMDLDAASLLKEQGLSERIKDLPDSVDPPLSPWTSNKWKVTQFQVGSVRNLAAGVDTYRANSAIHRDFACFFEPATAIHTSQKLRFFEHRTNSLLWTVSLKGGGGGDSVHPNGRSLLFQHGAQLTCVSPTGKSVLWSMPLPSRSVQLNRPFRALRSIANPGRPAFASGRRAPVAIVNEDYFCIRSRGSIRVYDSVTGEFLWSRDSVSPAASVLGTNQVVVVYQDGRQRMYRATDGALIDREELQIPETEIYGAIGSHFVVLDVAESRASIRLYDPLQQANTWTRKLPADGRIAFLSDREFLVLTNSSKLELIDLVSGEVTALKNEHKFGKGNVVAAATLDRVIIGSLKPMSEIVLNSSSQNVDDSLQTFSKQTGERLWQEKVEGPTAVLLSHFRTLPLIMLATNEQKITEERGRSRDYMLKDARTGEVLARRTVPTVFDHGYPELRLDLRRQFFELPASTRRYRFQPVSAD